MAPLVDNGPEYRTLVTIVFQARIISTRAKELTYSAPLIEASVRRLVNSAVHKA